MPNYHELQRFTVSPTKMFILSSISLKLWHRCKICQHVPDYSTDKYFQQSWAKNVSVYDRGRKWVIVFVLEKITRQKLSKFYIQKSARLNHFWLLTTFQNNVYCSQSSEVNRSDFLLFKCFHKPQQLVWEATFLVYMFVNTIKIAKHLKLSWHPNFIYFHYIWYETAKKIFN